MTTDADLGKLPRVTYELLDPEVLRDPYPLYARLRGEAPVHWSETLEGWALTRYEDVKPGLNAEDLSAERFRPYLESARADTAADPEERYLYESLQSWFTFLDPPQHTRLRTLTRTVMSGPMKAMADEVGEIVDRLLDRAVERGGEVDVIGDLARPLSIGAIVRLLGVPAEDEPRFTEWSERLTEFVGGATNIPQRRSRASAAMRDLTSYLVGFVEERRRRPADDLVSALIDSRRGEDELSDDEIIATAGMLLFAGHGTTTNLIGNGLLALLRNPDQAAALAAGEVPAAQAIEELLRYDSPVQITVRNALRDGALGHEEIEEGQRVFLFVASANRDAAQTADADTLDLRRQRPQHVTFGYGIHFCIGAPLARIEAPLFFERLLGRCGGVELVDQELRWQQTVGFRGLEQMLVRLNGRSAGERSV